MAAAHAAAAAPPPAPEAATPEAEIALATALARRQRFLFCIPFISRFQDLAEAAAALAADNPEDFNWAVSFDPDFIAELMYHGFLTMADRVAAQKYVLLPKLHKVRSVLDLAHMQVSKTARRLAKGFRLSMDADFTRVCDRIVQQHGENWFYKPLVAAFTAMNARGSRGCADGRVFLHSFELWAGGDDGDDGDEPRLVAGEVGYFVGASYTSLSGFADKDAAPSAGTVQMAALGSLLFARGFKIWDLGMSLDYKTTMGAKDQARPRFLARFRQVRDMPCALQAIAATPADQLIREFVSAQSAERTEREAEVRKRTLELAEHAGAADGVALAGAGLSKSQRKKLDKLLKKRARRALAASPGSAHATSSAGGQDATAAGAASAGAGGEAPPVVDGQDVGLAPAATS